MSDFKFACPGCGQRIAANDDYVGHQINCPSCQAVIVVPENPAAPPAPVKSSIAITTPPGMPPPPAPPKVGRLAVSALGSQQASAPPPSSDPEQQGSARFRAHQARKPQKSYSGLITGLVAVALVGVSAYLNRDWLTAKWKTFHGPSAAQIAATNQPPPPPPPELDASQIMQKVAEVYKAIPSFSSTGKIIAVMDTSAINPAAAAAGPQTVSGDLTVKMSKPFNFRIDSAISAGPASITVTGWSTNGSGDYLQVNNRRSKVPSHDALFSSFNSGVNVGVGEIVRLFIDDNSEGLAKAGLEWSRNQDENLAGQPCYVLAGTVKLQSVRVWVNRASFLIPQTQVVMDGKSGLAALDDAKIKEQLTTLKNGKEPTLLQIATVKQMAKITGSVTQTYENIQTNTAFAAADFQPGTPAPAPMRAGAPGQGGGGIGGGRASRIAGGAGRRGN